MSVIVKGMKMPDSCAVCRFAGRGGYFMERIVCMFTGGNEDAENVDRLPDCPLVALPDTHGRLVDADAMCADLATVDRQFEQMVEWCISVTEAQPTIVEAEGESCEK